MGAKSRFAAASMTSRCRVSARGKGASSSPSLTRSKVQALISAPLSLEQQRGRLAFQQAAQRLSAQFRFVEGHGPHEVEDALQDRQGLGAAHVGVQLAKLGHPQAQVVPLDLPDPLLLRVGQTRGVADPDRDQRPVVQYEIDVVGNESPKSVCGCLVPVYLDAEVEQLLGAAIEDGDQQTGLAREMRVDRRPGHAHRGADLVHPDLVETLAVEQIEGGLQDLRLSDSQCRLGHRMSLTAVWLRWQQPAALEVLRRI